MELTYTQCGDYLIPNLVLADTQEYHIGKYGRMRRAYLKEYRPALYVISRIAGEGKDRRLEPGDYYLSDAERADLQTLDESGLPVVLLLNAGGPVELTGLLDGMQHLDAILQLSQLGQQGGQAVADVLLGRAVPEGKLTATWARRYDDIPCARAFGSLNGDVSQDTYRDGVYVGYRYFDSFGVRPLFAFGFGLSYTTFALRAAGLDVQPGRLAVQVEVANTGARFAGREVAQVYLSAPQGELPRERRRLAGFAKTRRLAPGETRTLTLEIPQKQLAAFHPEQNAWVVDAGLYGVWVGNSSDALRLCTPLEVDAAVTLERTHPICPPQHPIGELGAAPGAQDREADQWRQKVEYDLPVHKFVPVAPAAPAPAAPLLAEGDLDSLVPLLYGNITAGASTLGSAGIRVPGSAGETSEALEASRQIPSLIMADGPAGLRLRQCYQADRATGEVYGAGVLGSLENGFLEAPPRHESADTYYQFCTAFPVGTALAQSWDPDLLAQVGRAVSREMDEFHVDLWLAPGMNIQRNPLCGRNFEYYSEDPLLTGTLAAAITAGVQESGRHGVTLKHFACNNQEFRRNDVEAVVSERALRELYLKGFELAVKEGGAYSVMTSYNPVNGFWSASNYDLLTTVLRGQWGYQGIVMTDWWAKSNDEGKPGERTNTSAMVRGQNDLFMVVENAQQNSMQDNSAEGLRSGAVSRAEFQRSACNICRVLLRMPALLRLRGIETELDRQLAESAGLEEDGLGEMYYVQAGNRTELDVSVINTEKGRNTQFSVSLQERGLYTLSLTLRSSGGSPLSQRPVSVFQDRKLLDTITLTGEETQWKTVTLNLEPAFSGSFYLRLFFAQSGLELRSCVLEMTQSLEEQIRAHMQ